MGKQGNDNWCKWLLASRSRAISMVCVYRGRSPKPSWSWVGGFTGVLPVVSRFIDFYQWYHLISMKENDLTNDRRKLAFCNMPELYQPNVHLSVRLPFESTIVSFANTIPNVLTPRGCTFYVQITSSSRRSLDLGYESLPNMSACGFMKEEGPMLLI